MSKLSLKEKIKQEKIKKKAENLLDSTARFMLNVFNKKSGNYSSDFEKLLIAGGGGNSMFVNCWAKPSSKFVKYRISDAAKKKLIEYNYNSIEDANKSNHKFLYSNKKGAKDRITDGKHLHLDHNPGNVKVLELIRNKCRKFDLNDQNYEDIIEKLKNYLKDIQTLDWITVEQDDIRSLGDDKYTKKEKEKMSAKQRDEILNDNFSYLYENNDESH